MIQELVFHLGDCKTGSTSIQYALANKSWQGEGLSVEYPTVVNHMPLAKSLTIPGEAKFQAKRFGFVKRKFGSSTATHGVISAEQFEFTDPVVLRDAIHKHLLEFSDRIRLIAYVRPHAERLVSTYAERVKKGKFHRPIGAMHKHLQQDGLLFYGPRLRKWRETFGDCFTVRPMLRDRLCKEDVVEDFFQYLFQGAAYQLIGKADANASLSLEDLAMLREFHKHIRKANPELRGPQQALGWNLSPFLAAYAPKPATKLRLHRALARDVVQVYGDDAAALDAEFFEGTPMSDALAMAPDKAVDRPQSVEAEAHYSPQAIAQMHAFADLFQRLMEADPGFFMRAIQRPEHRRHPAIAAKIESVGHLRRRIGWDSFKGKFRGQ